MALFYQSLTARLNFVGSGPIPSRCQVIFEETTKILSKSYLELVSLAGEAEIDIDGVPEQKLRRLMRVCRSVFDGRHYRILRSEAIELYKQIYGDTNFSNLLTEEIVYGIALYFWLPIKAPTAVANVSPLSGAAALYVKYSSGSTGTISSYVWDFGDDLFGYGKNISHVYLAAGTYNGSLTVSNPLSAPSVDTFTVVVSAPIGGDLVTEDGDTLVTEEGLIIHID